MRKMVYRNYKVNLLKFVSYKEIIHTPKSLWLKARLLATWFTFLPQPPVEISSPILEGTVWECWCNPRTPLPLTCKHLRNFNTQGPYSKDEDFQVLFKCHNMLITWIGCGKVKKYLGLLQTSFNAVAKTSGGKWELCRVWQSSFTGCRYQN